MSPATETAHLDARTIAFYRDALGRLDRAGIPYLVGGAYAFARYTGIERHTKDFDIFIRRPDYDRIAKVLGDSGYKTELTFPHWLGKAYKSDDEFIDLIFSAGNGVAVVDEIWFDNAVSETVIGMQCKLIPAEEMIWSKGLIMERERFDGADVAHVIHSVGPRLDWRRLIDRYAEHWRALYAHIVLYGYIYPSDRANVPVWVMQELSARLTAEVDAGNREEQICYGTIVSRQQYLNDINDRGYRDARLKPLGNMSAEDIAHWTAGIALDGAK
ncbi:MAG: hypothetical protein QOI24_464 [Acidobacteriota bacterium]|jgi:hypothetical protein|nr:hypothetical protein [Acidobacteriota bacterium]